MGQTNTTLGKEEALRALEHWQLPGPVERLEPGSGTANASVVVRAGGRAFVLKRRNPRYAVPQWVAFDHALMAHLREHGIPVPRPLPTSAGGTWAELEASIFELTELMPGAEHRWGNVDQVRAAGEMLGRFHEASACFRPPAAKSWDRYHSPGAALGALERIRAEAGALSPEGEDLLARCTALAQQLLTRLPDERYWSLPRTVVHGDWHPANLKFRGRKVVGVFDLDWCTLQPRMVDFADGLLFFCGHRAEPVVAGDIWSLTQSMELDCELMRAFGEGYGRRLTPTEDELGALGDLMRCRWLFCRVDAAERKVEPERRLEFIARDLFAPLQWLDAHAEELADGSLLRAG